MKFAIVLFCAASCAVTMKAIPFCTVSPGVWCEKSSGDAGNLPASSESTLGAGFLNSIIGQINDGTTGADMYSILIPDPTLFVASFAPDTNGGVTGLSDAALFLFDANGNGIEAADDGAALLSFTGTAGIYYIAIAPDGNLPRYKTGGNSFPIFTAFGAGDSFPVAGAGPVVNYSKNGCGTNCEGGYDISLTGADYSNLPEPGSLWLTGFAMLGLLALRHFSTLRRRSASNIVICRRTAFAEVSRS